MPRRPRRRIVGKWEQIEREEREEELKELERDLHGEQKRGRKPKPRPKPKHRRCRRKRKPNAPDTGSSSENGTDDTSSDG